MENRELICIGCPVGCLLKVELEAGKVKEVIGNACKRGVDYGKKECTNPTRILTTTVRVGKGTKEVVSVKTQKDIPKTQILECLKELKKVKIQAPVSIGDVIVYNILNTGSNIIATSNVQGR